MTHKRAVAPPIQTLFRPKSPVIQQHSLDNGLLIHELNAGSQPVVKLELMFRAGRPFENKQQVGRFTNHMIREGCSRLNSKEIAEKFDYYGSSLVVSESMDHSGFTLFSLRKHLPKVLPLFVEVLMEPAFRQEDLDKFRKNAIEKLKHDLSKNDFIAFREITAAVFGENSPYGYNTSQEIIESIECADLEKHFKTCYTASNALAFLSGKMDSKTSNLVQNALAQLPLGNYLHVDYHVQPSLEQKKLVIDSKQKHQLAIRLGKRVINRTHPDFHGLYILNTILGGYFGSRLMSNVREDKGYTYNIYSSIDTMLYDAALIISLETDPEYKEDSLLQISKELMLLCTEPIGQDELLMVKNYLLGYFLTALDGPLNASELVKSLYLDGQNLDDFNQLVDTIIHIKAEDLLHLAQRYLEPSSFIELIVM
jgi:zinc protease